MKLLTPTLLAATALSVALPSLAQAQSYQAQNYQDCESERQGRQVAGAIIGGLLGAVIGNELADDSNNNRRGRDHRYGRGGRGGHGSWGRGRGHRYQHRDRGNAEEVGTIAGLGVGAVIGAGIAGGDDCNAVRATPHNPYPGKPSGHYNNSAYSQNDPYYDDRYQAGYDDSAYYDDNAYYADSYDSSGELLGGAERAEPARTYNATTYGGQAQSAASYQVNSATGACHWSQTRRMDAYGQTVTDQVYMCQGADGIWRPADTYGQ